jgi:hypothetical protein
VKGLAIPASTEDVIARSTFRFDGVYLWVSAGEVRRPERHLMVTRDATETTVVTLEEELVHVEVRSRNPDRWLLLVIDCANPFYCVGFLAKIASALSGAGIDLLATSTFTRDWIFVKEAEGERAGEVLRGLGFQAL